MQKLKRLLCRFAKADAGIKNNTLRRDATFQRFGTLAMTESTHDFDNIGIWRQHMGRIRWNGQ